MRFVAECTYLVCRPQMVRFLFEQIDLAGQSQDAGLHRWTLVVAEWLDAFENEIQAGVTLH